MKARHIISGMPSVLLLFGTATTALSAGADKEATQGSSIAAPPVITAKGFKPFNPGDKFVFGGIPKEIFQTRVLYDVGARFVKDDVLANDGGEFNAPLPRVNWRQALFELSRSRLYEAALPDYIPFLNKVRAFQWENSSENGEPIVIADVEFDWIPDGPDKNPEMQKESDGSYTLKKPSGGLKTNRGHFFSAAFLPQTLSSPLVTAFLREEFIFSNTGEKIVSVDLQVQTNSFSIPLGGSLKLDLGDEEGPRVIKLTAHYEPGQKRKCSFEIVLKRPQGAWVNTKGAKGMRDFTIKRLPLVQLDGPTSNR